VCAGRPFVAHPRPPPSNPTPTSLLPRLLGVGIANVGTGASATAPAEGGEDAGAAMRHVPSAKDMEDAVTEGVAVEEGSDKVCEPLIRALCVCLPSDVCVGRVEYCV
jgi:hypothetical protein